MDVKRKTKSFLDELFCNMDEASSAEARYCIGELREHAHLVVMTCLESFLNIRESNKQHRSVLIELLLASLAEQVISSRQLLVGFEKFLPTLMDMDFPLGPGLIGDILSHFISSDFLRFEDLLTSRSDPHPLDILMASDKEKLLAGLLLGLVRLRSERVALDQWMAIKQLRPNIVKETRMSRWIERHNLSFLNSLMA
jgi:hypothetical protein